ncbi:MAG TPA: cyclic nucleotide-binding domain-containing protein [Candidatus Acidoferrum sp.]|nr:cyclic nucleotide-binding domain-containing protein [Candidatus Acidoferrum sp.]
MRRLLALGLVLSAALAAPCAASAFTPQEAILRSKPAATLIEARVEAEVTMDCGQGPVIVRPAPFIETGTGWFVDGRGYVITNAHVVDPVYRMPPWVTHELKKKAVDQACVEPALKKRGFMRGQRPDVEDQLRRDAARALASAQLTPMPQLTVLLANGTKLPAQVKKFSPPPTLDNSNKPLADSGRDLALLKVPDGVYPAITISPRDAQLGDAVFILGFPGVVLSHELLNQSATFEASATNGVVSGFKQDVIGQDIVQTDAPAAHGNSGGPAIGADAKLVGVTWSVTLSARGDIVQGFNFLIPARDVLKFIQGTDATKPGDSAFNIVWTAGIEALFSQRFSTAVNHFAEANRLVPNLPDVKRALRDAEFGVKNPPPRPFPWAWITLGVTLVSVGTYGGMWGRRWWKNRYRILPAQMIGFIERGLSPILVDARSKNDYETSPLKLPSSIRLDPDEATAGRINLDADPKQMIVVYCTSPEEQTSERVAAILRQRGLRNVRILKGGLGGWTNARLPVETKAHLSAVGLEIYKNMTLGDVERRHLKAGEYLCHEGDPGQEAFIIHSGAIEIRRRINGTDKVLARLGEGELVGEMALFRKAPRSTDMIAATESELLVITYERLEWLIRNRTQLTFEILKRLSELVVSTDSQRTPQAS